MLCAKKNVHKYFKEVIIYMYDNMPRRERLTPANNVNMSKVKDLSKIQEKMSCNLRPNRSKKSCAICPHFGFCKKAKRERTFIHQKDDAFMAKKVRAKKTGTDKYNTDPDLTENMDIDAVMDFEYQEIANQYPWND